MVKYRVFYGVGAYSPDDTFDSIDKAKQAADEGASYTQQSYYVEDEDGNKLYMRPWYGVAATDEDGDDIISFGDFGFFAEWQEY